MLLIYLELTLPSSNLCFHIYGQILSYIPVRDGAPREPHFGRTEATEEQQQQQQPQRQLRRHWARLQAKILSAEQLRPPVLLRELEHGLGISCLTSFHEAKYPNRCHTFKKISRANIFTNLGFGIWQVF